MTPSLIIHDMPEDVRRVLEALARAADYADRTDELATWTGSMFNVLVDREIAESAREILGRGK